MSHVNTYHKYWLSAFSEKKYKKCLLRTKTTYLGITTFVFEKKNAFQIIIIFRGQLKTTLD